MALISYATGTSAVPLIGKTIGEMFDEIAARYPDTEAVVSVHEGIRWTYRELHERVEALARGLMALGVEKGDRVGLWMMNHADWIVTQVATAKIGAVLVNINPAYRTYELEYALRQSEVQTLIVQGRFKTSDYVGMFYESCPEAYDCKAGRIESEKFPFLKNVIFAGEIPYNGMFLWSDVIRKGEGVNADELAERAASLDFDDPVNIQYTSGTTGFPKGVVLSHHSVMNNGYIIGEGMRFYREGPALHPRAVLPLLRHGPLEHGLPDPRLDHGPALAGLRRRDRAPDHPGRAVHGRPRRPDHVHRRARPPQLPELLPRHAPDRDHGRLALPRRGDEAGQHAHEHVRDRDRATARPRPRPGSP